MQITYTTLGNYIRITITVTLELFIKKYYVIRILEKESSFKKESVQRSLSIEIL